LLWRQPVVIARDVERQLVVLEDPLVGGVILAARRPVEPSSTRFLNANRIVAGLKLIGGEIDMGQSAAHCICASEVASQYLFVVLLTSGSEVGVEFVAVFHILEHPEDTQGGLLSAEPEVSAIAVVHEPQGGLRQHRAIRMSEAQQADRIRG